MAAPTSFVEQRRIRSGIRQNAVASTCCSGVAVGLAFFLRAKSFLQPAFLDVSWTPRLETPAQLAVSLPVPRLMQRFINSSRVEVAAVLHGEDDRLMAIVGPCSIHDPAAARDYAQRLRQLADTHRNDLLVLMRGYLEKPRTSVGWRGIISDPDMTGAEDLERGVALGRKVLLDLNAAGLPVATEFLDPLFAPFVEDLITYGSIGARTVESPTHRAMAAALPMPVGFKNGRGGDVQSAVNAVVAASSAQRRLAVDSGGRLRALQAQGNADGHVILRGSEAGPNYDADAVADAAMRLAKANLADRRIVVDCSHGNSGKKHEGQLTSCGSVAAQVAAGSGTIGGVMVESFLEAGNQKLEPGVTDPKTLKRGVSVTDACLDFSSTASLLGDLAKASRSRRAVAAGIARVEASGEAHEGAKGNAEEVEEKEETSDSLQSEADQEGLSGGRGRRPQPLRWLRRLLSRQKP